VVAPCGTNAAYNRHVYEKTPKCDPCREAHAKHRRDYRARQYLTGREHFKLDATGTHRRIRSLIRMGWRMDDIAEVAVPDHTSGGKWVFEVLKQPKVRQSTYDAISRAYEALSARRGPSQRNATYASNKGWVPPFAWDDIDDPKERPQGYLRPSDIRKIVNGKA
jgi:hypothetical protein